MNATTEQIEAARIERNKNAGPRQGQREATGYGQEIWNKIQMSCDKSIFKGKNMFAMTPDELDEVCGANGILWEELGMKTIQIHACGFECSCHGGDMNRNLRPRP